MKILKRWREAKETLEAQGEPTGWFETTLDECIEHTEVAGFWKPETVVTMLKRGKTVTTPDAEWMGVNSIQEAVLALVRMTQYNSFNGERVARELLENRHLWRGVIFQRDEFFIMLRDIEKGEWNADTLYILAEDGTEDALEKLAAEWEPQTMEWEPPETICKRLGVGKNWRHCRVLRLWWD